MTIQEDHNHLDENEEIQECSMDSPKSTENSAEITEDKVEKTNVDTPSELELLQAEIENMKEKYIHSLAETENEKRRIEKDYKKSVIRSVGNAIKPLLGPLDQFEKALAFAETMSDEVKNWAVGFQMILAQLKDTLHAQHIFSFDSLGKKFDPYRHDAISTEETDEVEEGIVLEEFEKGYQYHDQILRPAKVKVSKHPEKKVTEKHKEQKVTKEHKKENIT